MRGRERSQSEVLGTALIIAMTLLGTGVVVAVGGVAIDQTRQELSGQTATNEMTLFDSRVSVAALGQSGPQTVELHERSGGHYEVRPSAGWIKVTQDTDDGTNVLVPQTSMGAVVYERDGREIAYQAGGVWRGQRGKGSAMVSPPEFDYGQSTLTLPIIRVKGSDSASGGATARIQTVDSSLAYPVGGDANPVEDGHIDVTIKSRYYLAWAHYFETQTAATVANVDHDTQTVTAELTAAGARGNFRMPGEGDAIRVRGLADDHAINEFRFTLKPDEGSTNFENLDWKLEATSGTQQFTVRLVSRNGKPCEGGYLDAYITYHGETATQTWKVENALGREGFTMENCGGMPSLEVDLTETSERFSYQGEPSPLTFDDHAADTDETYTVGQEESANYLVNHYLERMGSNVDLVVEDNGSGATTSVTGGVAEASSYGTIEYGAGQKVTYLRITDNVVKVTLT